MSTNKQERRVLSSSLTLRKTDTGRTVSGRGITYNALSKNMGFREKFQPGSLTIDPSMKCLWSHDSSQILGTVRSGTMTIDDRADGLYYSVSLPNTTLGRDVQTLLERGDIGFDGTDSVSFGFVADDDSWSEANGEVIRTVTAATVFEISILGNGDAAYSQNTVSLRNVPAGIRAKLKRDAGSATDVDADCDPTDPDGDCYDPNASDDLLNEIRDCEQCSLCADHESRCTRSHKSGSSRRQRAALLLRLAGSN